MDVEASQQPPSELSWNAEQVGLLKLLVFAPEAQTPESMNNNLRWCERPKPKPSSI